MEIMKFITFFIAYMKTIRFFFYNREGGLLSYVEIFLIYSEYTNKLNALNDYIW